MEEKTQSRLGWAAGALVLLAVIFGVPAVLVPMSMDDVPTRSQNRVIANFQAAVELVEVTYDKHRQESDRRMMPIPGSGREWIESLNPMGRKAPGGGLAYLPQANPETGAIGIDGDAEAVTITMPAYRDLARRELVIKAKGE